MLFGESFGTLAKERLDAATALKKTTFTGRGATPRDTKAAGVATSPAATREVTRDGPQLATKPPRAKRND